MADATTLQPTFPRLLDIFRDAVPGHRADDARGYDATLTSSRMRPDPIEITGSRTPSK